MKTKTTGIVLIIISALLITALILNVSLISNSVTHNIDQIKNIKNSGYNAGYSVGYFLGYNLRLLIILILSVGGLIYGYRLTKSPQVIDDNRN
ncbi:MAG: hypothetical protein IE931_08855 [Sphingobacteriales bacterium]|nr:hypothetical protein [Sphingobacteriales bacterium]